MWLPLDLNELRKISGKNNFVQEIIANFTQLEVRGWLGGGEGVNGSSCYGGEMSLIREELGAVGDL